MATAPGTMPLGRSMRMAAVPSSGHWYSQVPQPMQRSVFTTGRVIQLVPPWPFFTIVPSVSVIALWGSGQTS